MNYVIASIYQTEPSCDAAFVVCELLSYFIVKNTSYFLNDKIVTVRAIKGAHECIFYAKDCCRKMTRASAVVQNLNGECSIAFTI